MNNQQNSILRLHEILTKANTGVIVLPANPTVDAIASATALYLGLVKMGKAVTLASSQPVQNDLTAADKFQSELVSSGDNLVVSFPYTDGAIDKVDYNIQGSNFNLIITPRQGYPKMQSDQVKYSYAGGMLDFIIVIDSPTLNSLGNIYTDNQTQFQGREIVNIDRHLTNAFYGTINLVNKTSSSVSELILELLQQLKLEIDKDMSTNLYAGVAAATNNFTSYSVNADTFEHIAQLLRFGAMKKIVKKPVLNQPQQNDPFEFDSGPINPSPMPFQPPQPQNQPQQQPVNKPQPKIQIHGSNQHPEIQTRPVEVVEKESKTDDQQTQTAQDWLKPKIFKGSGLI